MEQETQLETTDTNDGRHDFDFLFGEWRVANRKRANPLAEGDVEWLHFESRAETCPIFGGLGNVDTYSAPAFVGRFVDGHGRFEGDDVIEGRPLRVRFDWKDITPSSARWEQAFSFDGGVSFETNWSMELTREP